MARPKVKCPFCQVLVPKLEECVRCGMVLPPDLPDEADAPPAEAPGEEPPPLSASSAQRPAASVPPETKEPDRDSEAGLSLLDRARGQSRSAIRVNVEFGETPPDSEEARRKAAALIDDPSRLGWKGYLFIATALLFLGFAMSFHVVTGARLGSSRILVPKRTTTLAHTFVDLAGLNPGPGFFLRFRQAEPDLYEAVRGALLAQLGEWGLEGAPVTSTQERELEACYGNQLMIEGARRRFFVERGVDRRDVGAKAFFEDMKAEGFLAGVLGDPGQGKDSSGRYRYDESLGRVTCANHGAVERRSGGDFWDATDYRLFFTTEPLPPRGARAGASPEVDPGLAARRGTALCLSRIANLSFALKAYSDKMLAGQKLTALDRDTVKDLVEREYLVELPHCPREADRFPFVLTGYQGSLPVITCSEHKHRYP